MSLGWHFRSGSDRTISIRVILASVALLAVLAARNVPPDFVKAPSVHSQISAGSHHDQRPRFDRDGPQWSAPIASFLLVPLAVESAHLGPAPQLASALQTKGFHYNRPPPTR